jgi:hypothetical protein
MRRIPSRMHELFEMIIVTKGLRQVRTQYQTAATSHLRQQGKDCDPDFRRPRTAIGITAEADCDLLQSWGWAAWGSVPAPAAD